MATGYGQEYGRQGRPGFGGVGAGDLGRGRGGGRRRLPAVLRAPVEARTFRELAYLILSLPLSSVMFALTVALVPLGAGLLVTFIGFPVLVAGLACCRGFGVLERTRARALLGLDVAPPEPIRPAKRGAMAWVGGLLRSGASWRHLLYSVIHFPWAVFAGSISVGFWSYGWALLTYPLWRWVFPMYLGTGGLQLYGDATHSVYLDNPSEIAMTSLVGLLVTLVTPWIMRSLTTVDRLLVRGLLGPSKLATRVVELESDRGVVVDTAAADLRRIERDLHDGAQARLVNLAMGLGLAKEKLPEDPHTAATMVEQAHSEAKLALQELRDLARGIHPAILTDRGLNAALTSATTRCTTPVHTTVDLPTRPTPAIEGIAYFTISELLQNISKHSGASSATVDVWKAENRLLIQVTDDGVGGANLAAGTGLRGLADRLDAVDGVLVVDSPVGGPTRITAELPWRDRLAPGTRAAGDGS